MPFHVLSLNSFNKSNARPKVNLSATSMRFNISCAFFKECNSQLTDNFPGFTARMKRLMYINAHLNYLSSRLEVSNCRTRIYTCLKCRKVKHHTVLYLKSVSLVTIKTTIIARDIGSSAVPTAGVEVGHDTDCHVLCSQVLPFMLTISIYINIKLYSDDLPSFQANFEEQFSPLMECITSHLESTLMAQLGDFEEQFIPLVERITSCLETTLMA